MATAEDVAALRLLIAEPEPDTYSDEDLAARLDAGTDPRRSTTRIWPRAWMQGPPPTRWPTTSGPRKPLLQPDSLICLRVAPHVSLAMCTSRRSVWLTPCVRALSPRRSLRTAPGRACGSRSSRGPDA